MNMNAIQENPEIDDRRLIELHLAGDSTAFRQIVERHQGMVCALAYSMCGNVARSEDVAQEVFVVAWKQLPHLREPAKLRAWLGGMTRNLAYNSLRRAKRTPTTWAAELSPDMPAEAANPRDQAIGADEAALMWNALSALPESYREPMVLFYRQGQSTALVATVLDVSEETVRQRLARGRALLTERMAKLVQEALGRSAPLSTFAARVLLALPRVTAPVAFKTATGGAAAKTLATAGSVGGAAAKGGVIGKLLGAFAGVPSLVNGLAEYRRFRANFESSPEAARREVVEAHVRPLLITAALLGIFAIIVLSPLPSKEKLLALILPGVALVLAARAAYRREKILVAMSATPAAIPVFEYRSRGKFFGMPWIHVLVGAGWKGRRAVGWMAVSDGAAIGGLFASGRVAVAPFSVGGMALGLGTLGVLAVGGWSVGGLALAGDAARGGLAVALNFAEGGRAVAAHANDAVAADFFRSHEFFRGTAAMGRVAIGMAFFAWLPPLLLIGWRTLRNRL